jgi:hypothetical protein
VGAKLTDFRKSIVMEWDPKGADKKPPELFE